MSGDVGCWSVWKGILVGVLVFRTSWFESIMSVFMVLPRWSGLPFEYHRGEWALKSPVSIEFGSAVRVFRQLVIVSSSIWRVSLVAFESRGVMYRLFML